LLTALQKRSLRSAKGTQLRPLWPRSQGTSQSVFARGPSNPVPHPDLSPSSPVPHPDLSPVRTVHTSPDHPHLHRDENRAGRGVKIRMKIRIFQARRDGGGNCRSIGPTTCRNDRTPGAILAPGGAPVTYLQPGHSRPAVSDHTGADGVRPYGGRRCQTIRGPTVSGHKGAGAVVPYGGRPCPAIWSRRGAGPPRPATGPPPPSRSGAP